MLTIRGDLTMKYLHAPKSTLTRLAIGALAVSAVAGPVLLSSAAASAATCGGATLAGTSCSLTGTATLTGGTLASTSPSALGWSGTLTGLDLNLVDTTAADQSYLVDDATGSHLGWHVTVSATTFTSGSNTLSDTGTFSTNGSLSSMTSTNAPSPACLSGSTCTLPTNSTSYPVAITTGSSPSPVTVYDTAALGGLGSMKIGGGANPVGWWLNIPSNTLPGSYTSTVTMEVISAP